MEKLKFKLTIAFEGTHYQGWQVQKVGVGVQEHVHKAVHKLFPNASHVQGSSRTDTGVHALGLVAHFEAPKEEFCMPPAKLRLALNAFLPEDIRVMEAVPCRADFHAQYDATGKQYRYFVWNHAAQNPLWRRKVWQTPRPLNLAAMRAAARQLIGKHDFKAFSAKHPYEIEDTVRTLTRCDIRRSGPLFVFILEGEGFLYKMCRRIVGTLVQIGLGKHSSDEIPAMLDPKRRALAGMTAPAHGLVLWKVFYGRRAKQPDLSNSPA